jgi:hypothetical protein
MTVDFSGRARKAAPARSRAAQMTRSLFSLRVRKSAICRAMPARARGSVPGLAGGISPRRLLTISHRAVGKQAQMTKSQGGMRGRPPVSA